MSDDQDYIEIEHTADWALRVRGGTLPELFAHAAAGMYNLMAGPLKGPLTFERIVEVKGVDAEALLVNWLNELVYHTEMDGEVFGEFEIESFESVRLRARVRGRTGVELKKEIKAVTFHNLRIAPVEGGYQATIVFDV